MRYLLNIIVPVLFGILFMGGIIFLFGNETTKSIVKWNAAKTWEVTEGKVLTSKRAKYGRRSRAEIKYEFHVGDKLYQSWKVDPSGTGNVQSVNDSDRLVRLHPVGSNVTVYYDPADPTASLLYQNFSVGIWVNVISLLTFSFLPIIIVYMSWLETRRANRFGPDGRPKTQS